MQKSSLYGIISSVIFILMGTLFSPVATATNLVRKCLIQQEIETNGSRDYNVLGSVYEFSTTQTLAEYYNYRGETFHGGSQTLSPNQSHLFCVRAKDGFGIFSVHGGHPETKLSLVDVDYQLSGATFDLVVEDEPQEISFTDNTIRLRGFWGVGKGDGVAFRVNDDDDNWQLRLSFNNLFSNQLDDEANDVVSSSLKNLLVLSPSSNALEGTTSIQDDSQTLSQSLHDGITFVITPVSERIPEPSSLLGLLMIGGMGVGSLVMSKNRR